MGVGSSFFPPAQIIAIFGGLLGNLKGIDKVCTFTLACLVRNIWNSVIQEPEKPDRFFSLLSKFILFDSFIENILNTAMEDI